MDRRERASIIPSSGAIEYRQVPELQLATLVLISPFPPNRADNLTTLNYFFSKPFCFKAPSDYSGGNWPRQIRQRMRSDVELGDTLVHLLTFTPEFLKGGSVKCRSRFGCIETCGIGGIGRIGLSLASESLQKNVLISIKVGR